jgi:hypothetical protein
MSKPKILNEFFIGDLNFHLTINALPISQRLFLPVTAFNTAPPTLRSNPWRVMGTPVARAIFCFTFVTPTARLSEKVTPGIFIIE